MTIGEIFNDEDLLWTISHLFAKAFKEKSKDGEFGTPEYWRLADMTDAIKEVIAYTNLDGISFSPRNIKKWRKETIEEIVDEMRQHTSCSASDAFYDAEDWKKLCDRILAAHNSTSKSEIE